MYKIKFNLLHVLSIGSPLALKYQVACYNKNVFVFKDSFLPHVEDGTIVLIGATTENPSFHLNNALLSRCKLVVLSKLSECNIQKILMNAVEHLGGSELSEGDEKKGEEVEGEGEEDSENQNGGEPNYK